MFFAKARTYSWKLLSCTSIEDIWWFDPLSLGKKHRDLVTYALSNHWHGFQRCTNFGYQLLTKACSSKALLLLLHVHAHCLLQCILDHSPPLLDENCGLSKPYVAGTWQAGHCGIFPVVTHALHRFCVEHKLCFRSDAFQLWTRICTIMRAHKKCCCYRFLLYIRAYINSSTVQVLEVSAVAYMHTIMWRSNMQSYEQWQFIL